MPQRIENTLLVVEGFKDASGTEWRPGDRASLARRAVREAAARDPALFVVEFSTEPLDPASDWFCELQERYEEDYRRIKRQRDGAEERRQKALREEMRMQERGQPDLERRYERQEKERAERERKLVEARERRQIEDEMELQSSLTSGFHFNDL